MIPRKLIFLLSVGALSACGRPAEPPLPVLKLEPSRVAVAGVSSGAYMATQAHLAWSDRIHGAALLAGGPYGCAMASLETALGTCMKAEPEAPDIAALAALARSRADRGDLALLENLADDPVLVMHGRHDATVAEPVSRAAFDLYRELRGGADGEGLMWEGGGEFGHLLPTLATGADCVQGGTPWLGACGIDAAGRMFEALFGQPRREVAEAAIAEPLRFDQNRYRPDGADAYLTDAGYVYLPPRCAAGEPCGLLVVFHGCQQNDDAIGEALVREAGFNRWADAFDVAVLYPQTRSSYVPLNPRACWDWWGFSGSDYDTRSGVQQRWLSAAMDALAGVN